MIKFKKEMTHNDYKGCIALPIRVMKKDTFEFQAFLVLEKNDILLEVENG